MRKIPMDHLKQSPGPRSSRKAFALATILFLIPLFLILALAFMSLAGVDYTFSGHMARKIRAHYLAESGTTYAYSKRAQWTIPTPDNDPERMELKRNGVSLGKVKMWVRMKSLSYNNVTTNALQITSQGMDPSGVYTKIVALMNPDGEIISWNEEETQRLEPLQRYQEWWNYTKAP
jgi:hypothetical protein